MSVDTPDPSEHFAERLRLAINHFIRATRDLPGTLSWAQADTLAVLEANGAMSIARLAARRRVRHQGMSRTVGDLEAAGLITRVSSADDARAQSINLSEDGRVRLGEDRRLRAAALEQLTQARLDGDARRILAAIPEVLNRLAGGEG